ncbi:MAG: ABC transporter ATP-binding protein [Candidatus Zixiibacteriota bacterium]|nr:MAG: ABC transporter ATP-binding protein [candidate division Zixibacteria bacterium]
MEQTDNNVIVTKDVKKIYDENGVPVEALRGVDLAIKHGEFTAIVGPSGSGKTTFLNVISGLDTVSSGKVWLGGKELSSMSGRELSDYRRDSIGFIFQAYNLIPVLTVEENIEYIMLLQGVAREDRRERVEEILRQVDLTGFSHRLPTKLSGGQQQRVAVARAMVARPKLVLADEPTANLDSTTGAGLLDMMRELNQTTGMTFVFSTHDRMIMERATRLVTLKDGRVDSDEKRTGE